VKNWGWRTQSPKKKSPAKRGLDPQPLGPRNLRRSHYIARDAAASIFASKNGEQPVLPTIVNALSGRLSQCPNVDYSIPPEKKNQIIDIRAGRYVCLEGEGLVILGCIGYELLNFAPSDWREYIRKLASLNWQEADPIWTSSIRQRVEQPDPQTGHVVVTYKKLSAYSAVSRAIENVREAIGWTKPDPLNLNGAADAELPKDESASETEVTVVQD